MLVTRPQKQVWTLCAMIAGDAAASIARVCHIAAL
jgi:hypothetical protein